MKKILTVLLLALCLFGCSAKKGGASEITLRELTKKIEAKESFAVILTYNGCAWCAEAEPVFDETAKEEGVEAYYVDFTNARNNETETYDADFEALTVFANDVLMEEDGEKVFYVPHALFVKDGVIVSDHIGTVESHDPYTAKMTDAEKTELVGYYTTGFQAIQ